MQRQHDSFPRLYGGSAQFRQAGQVGQTERPASADDLPLEFDRSHDDQKQADQLLPRPYRYGARPMSTVIEEDTGEIQPSSVSLRGLADKFLRERGERPLPQFTKPMLKRRSRSRRGAM